jgi:hypothetical protein
MAGKLFEDLLAPCPEFVWLELGAARVVIVVPLNLAVAVETQRQSVFDIVAAFRRFWDYVVYLDVHATRLLAVATMPIGPK